MKFRVTSIRQRMVLYILIPTIVFLISVEFFGFHSIQAMLLEQLRSSANNHLKRTATLIDSRLILPKKLLYLLQTAPSEEIHEYLHTALSSLDGVSELYEVDRSGLTQNPQLQVEYDTLYMGKSYHHANLQIDISGLNQAQAALRVKKAVEELDEKVKHNLKSKYAG